MEAATGELGKAVNMQLDGLSYKKSKQINAARASYQRSYWKLHKIQQHLADGSHPAGMAKLLSEVVGQHWENMHTAAGQIEHPGELTF